VQEGHRRFVPDRAEKCPTSSGDESSVLSCIEVLAVGVTSRREVRRSSQVSRREWRKWVRATLLVTSQGPGE
jgi:hypothetical protein